MSNGATMIEIDFHGNARIRNGHSGELVKADHQQVLFLYALAVGGRLKPGEFVDDAFIDIIIRAFEFAVGARKRESEMPDEA